MGISAEILWRIKQAEKLNIILLMSASMSRFVVLLARACTSSPSQTGAKTAGDNVVLATAKKCDHCSFLVESFG